MRRALVIAFVLLVSCGCDTVRQARLKWSGASEGKIVANIGMPLEEAERRSTLKLAERFRNDRTGEQTTADNADFDFEVAGTRMRFEKCYYYWLATAEGGDTRLKYITFGFPHGGLPRAQLDAARADVQARLKADAWEMGHFVWERKPTDTPRMHDGPDGTGLLWAKGDTLLILHDKRIDEERPGEDEQAGAFIIFVELQRRGAEPHANVVFDSTRR